jgi:hypothetical protein
MAARSAQRVDYRALETLVHRVQRPSTLHVRASVRKVREARYCNVFVVLTLHIFKGRRVMHSV